MSTPEIVVDENTQDFYARLAYWQREIDEGGEEVIERFSQEAVKELDELCPYNGLACEFSGTGLMPDIDDAGLVQSISLERAEQRQGYCTGFNIRSTDHTSPKFMYEFIIYSEQTQPTGCEYDRHVVCAYIDPADAMVMPLESPPSVDTSDVPIQEILSKASDLFAVTLASKRFRQLDREAQRSFIDNFLQRFEKETAITQKEVAIQGLYFYLLPKGGTTSIENTIVPFNEEYIHGNCLSLGFLGDKKLNKKPIRHKRDLIDRMAGLCLVVEAKDFQPDLSLCRGDIAYIPLSSQKIEAIVAPRSS